MKSNADFSFVYFMLCFIKELNAIFVLEVCQVLRVSSKGLFIIGASNIPDLIDALLLRPGRFDKLLYVGVTIDPPYRERVLKALTRKFKLHEDVSLYSIAKKCPPNFTGVDMYAFCVDAWFHAAKRKVLAADADPTNMNYVVVEYEDFVTL
ncbi:peroxisome biogenesis protein 6 isoform X3 [Helianthus annuus]|uniref:peroxisome biogenesis protein 6 isoform X3 n=1 Tax=Helianthus annuus TaxID=4232 RepID=UPI000B90636E|nr:peroxisome biogenesis protein 6 isoform X3 [Helianthus annuus]